MRILRNPAHITLNDDARVEVRGIAWERAREIVMFATPDGGGWSRVFYQKQEREEYRTYPAAQVRILASANRSAAAADVLSYWRAIVSGLPNDN